MARTPAYLTGVSARRTHEPVGHGSPDFAPLPCPTCARTFRAAFVGGGTFRVPSHGSADVDTLARDPDALCGGSGTVVKL